VSRGNPNSPILDYAGPISRSGLRLAATSELKITSEPRRLVVRETLAGRGGAIGALVFAGFVFFVMINVELDMWHKWRRHVQEMTFFAGLMTAEGAVGMLVVNQTWRRTVLEVTPVDVSLVFASPFAAGRKFHWPAEQVAQVAVVDSTLGQAGPRVPELELAMWSGPPVRLFTGHPQAQLAYLAQTIRAIQPTLPEAAAGDEPDSRVREDSGRGKM
jgi:hypothetical protein